MRKLTLYLDMDGVLVDLAAEINRLPAEVHAEYGNDIDEYPGLFDSPPPMPGAINAVQKLLESGRYDIHILSTAPWGNPGALTAKRLWLERHFGTAFKKKVTLTHRKDNVQGDILVDDRPNNGAENFNGKWIRYGSGHYPDWDAVLAALLPDGFYWFGPSVGAYDVPVEATEALMMHWLEEGHKVLPEIPEKIEKRLLEVSASGIDSGQVSLPEEMLGPFDHPSRTGRKVAWLPSSFIGAEEEILDFAVDMGLNRATFVPSENPHLDVQFLREALPVLSDLVPDVASCAITRFELRLAMNKRSEKAAYRSGGGLPLIPAEPRVMSSVGVQFLDENTAYLFQSSGPAKMGAKSASLVHRIDGKWHAGKQLLSLIS